MEAAITVDEVLLIGVVEVVTVLLVVGVAVLVLLLRLVLDDDDCKAEVGLEVGKILLLAFDEDGLVNAKFEICPGDVELLGLRLRDADTIRLLLLLLVMTENATTVVDRPWLWGRNVELSSGLTR